MASTRKSICIYIDGENISSKYWIDIDRYIISKLKKTKRGGGGGGGKKRRGEK